MADLEQLRAQVEAAQSRIGEMGESRKAHDERLLGLIGSLEQGLVGKQEEVERQQATITALQSEKSALDIEMDALEAENAELKGLLTSLLSMIDESSGDPVAAALDALGRRVAGGETEESPPAEPAMMQDEPESSERPEAAAEPESAGLDPEALEAGDFEAGDINLAGDEANSDAAESAVDELVAMGEAQADEDDAVSEAPDLEAATAEPDELELSEQAALEAGDIPVAETAPEACEPVTPCSPEMAAVIEAADAAADRGSETVAAEPHDEAIDDAAVLEQIASEVTAVAEGDVPALSLDDGDDELGIEALELEEEALSAEPLSAETADAPAGDCELSSAEIEALLEAGAPLLDEADAKPSGRPSTVKKIIERVSALAEEMVEDDPDALLKAAASLDDAAEARHDETAEAEADQPSAATGT